MIEDYLYSSPEMFVMRFGRVWRTQSPWSSGFPSSPNCVCGCGSDCNVSVTCKCDRNHIRFGQFGV